MNKYVDDFMKLKCSEDILKIIGHINRIEKEISESMSIIKQLRKIKNKEKYILYDLCAGNGLTGILCAFLFNFKKVISIDIRKPKYFEKLKEIKDYEYRIQSIDDFFVTRKPADEYIYDSIYISVHPCRDLAKDIVKEFKFHKTYSSHKDKLFLIPCCHPDVKKYLPSFLNEKLGGYERWCYYLYNCIDERYNKNILQDKHNMSPCNIIIKVI